MKSFSFLAVAGSLLLSSVALANPPLPAPSPRAVVTQTVGITDVTVDYASPGLKGRKVFGGLVPYGQLWRFGANAATKLTLSRDGTIAGKPAPAGTYALFAIPTAKSWTIVVNKNPNQGGTNTYDEKLDLMRFEVTPVKVPKRERMTFIFSETTDATTRLDVEWEELRASIPIAFDTKAQTLAAISAHMDSSWRSYANAARYYDEIGDAKNALAAIDAALAVKETWFSLWVKAQIVAKGGDVKAAYALAEKAHELGTKDTYFFWKADVEKALADWKKKL
jgi:hypothetical protein